MVMRIGTSGWSYDHWHPELYPPGLPARDRLARYAAVFPTAELNSSFYRWPRPAAFGSWRDRLPDGFRLSVKAPRGLTHARKLYAPEPWLHRIAAGWHELGGKRAVLLVQLPPSLPRDDARLAYFLGLVPGWMRVAVELRHRSWHCEETFTLLEAHRAAYCVMSGANLPCTLRATTDFVYVRMHGPDHHRLYAGSYPHADLTWWADRIREWDLAGLDVFVYFNNDGNANAVRNARTLAALPARLDHGGWGSIGRCWQRRDDGGAVMAKVGYTLMTEQAGPKDLVRWAARAEEVGFDLLVSSDHYFPWLDEQGHAPNAWVTLGAVAQVTGRAELMTYVTCPSMRYHPAVVAQQAATLALLSDNRFTLGLGAGENLNEHVIGEGWPDADQRQEMLAEAVSIIRALLGGGYVNFEGAHFRVDAARIWDLPGRPVPLGVAVSGQQSCELFAPLAEVMIAVEPDGSLAGWWDAASGAGRPARKVGQMPVCWGSDREECIRRAHEQFRWFGGGWKVNAELPGTAGFACATSFVRPEDVAGSIPCGDSVDAVAEAAGAFFKAGFTDLALVQIGGTEPEQDGFFAAAPELITAVKETAG